MRRFTHTFPQRISALLLCLALLVGLLPTSALAAGTDTGRAIQLGTSGISGFDTAKGGTGYDYIYFGSWTAQDKYTTSGPIKWRVLSMNGNSGTYSDGTNTVDAKNAMFLLSDVLLGTGADGGVYFGSSNVWQNSTAQEWCETFYSGNLTTQEQGAVLATTKSDSAHTSTSSGYEYGESSLSGDKVFFLSAEEAESSKYGFTNDTARIANYGNSAGNWWLRSPFAGVTSSAGVVNFLGYVGYSYVYFYWAARPAFNLDLNSVLFTSAAEGGKSASGMDAGLTAVNDYNGSDWKLTLFDDKREFSISVAVREGDTINFSYSGAQTGEKEYISAVIIENGELTHYGRILQLDGTTNGESGSASITLPADVTLSDTVKLYVFNEQYNGGENDDTKLTDYASQLCEVTFDTTAPALTAGATTRDSETSATVKFTSDEAGSYYYEVVNSGESQPTINTTGAGTSCVSGENTISLTSLSGAGAKDIYIVAKDAVGNESISLKITIPAIYTLTVNLNGGSGSTTDGTYPAGKVVNIDAGSRSNYRFNGWTSSSGGTFADASSANTTFTMPAENVTITANWQYDPPYIPPTKPDGPSTGTSDGWEDIVDELADAEDGDTITIDMNGETEVPGDIWDAIAGKDVTVILDMGEDISWTVDGSDVPTATSFSSMDFGVDMNTSGISVDVINTVTGELGSVQITLAHGGEFGFTLTLSAPLGKENAGYWANLYHYNEVGKTLDFETSAQVASDGTASLRMTHASQYAIVIDDKSHDLPFTDLGEGQWYESAVRYAYTHDIMEGTSPTTFVPNTSLTRAEAVQVLYNLEGQPDISDENLGYPYEDVNAQAWYGDAVYWARLTGVATGYGDGTFQPGDSITRQEFAQMLYNYAKYKGYDLSAEGDLSTFPDANSIADWAETAMSWANGNELINGHDDGTIDAGGIGTRAQAASILMRFDQNLVKN